MKGQSSRRLIAVKVWDGRSRIFEPDTLIPAVHGRNFRPEENLCLAVLVDALDTLQKYHQATNSKGRRLWWEASYWVRSDDRQWPFAFLNICELLDLDPDAVRTRAMARADGQGPRYKHHRNRVVR